MEFNLELNVSTLIKLTLLILLLTTHIIFIVNEYYKPKELQLDTNHLKSGLVDIAGYKKIGTWSAGMVALVSGLITIKNEIILQNNQKELENKIQEAKDLKNQLIKLQEEAAKQNTTNTEILDSTGKIVSSIKSVENNLNTVSENFQKFSLMTKNSQNSVNQESKVLKALEDLNTSNTKVVENISTSVESAKIEAEKIIEIAEPKASLFLFSDLIELLDRYDGYAKVFLSLILFRYLVIGSCLSILFIIYGNYLIEKFNIQTKYPKIYKILSLRIKYQKYYIIMNVSFIILVSLSEALAFIYFFM